LTGSAALSNGGKTTTSFQFYFIPKRYSGWGGLMLCWCWVVAMLVLGCAGELG
jgi:hypothetical protein